MSRARYPTSLELLGTMLSDITAPTLMINSAVDPLVPAVKGDYLHERSAKSTLVNVDTIHFVARSSVADARAGAESIGTMADSGSSLRPFRKQIADCIRCCSHLHRICCHRSQGGIHDLHDMVATAAQEARLVNSLTHNWWLEP
jgi:hypothetical protein